MTNKKSKSGFVLVCGIPNAGKSSFLNGIIGDKISGVTDKPQTTRKRNSGILTDKELEYQIVFIDTPGFHTSSKLINKLMNEQIFESIKEIDLILYITDISCQIDEDEKSLITILKDIQKKYNIPIIALLNKIDIGINKEKSQFLEDSKIFENFIQISAIKLDTKQVLDNILKFIPENPFYYPEDIISTMYEKEQVVEVLQEKIFLVLHQEIPYSTYAEVLQFNENEDFIEIDANICCEKESQKPIIIGKNAEIIKKIRKLAEKDLKFIFNKKVKCNLFVKVVKDWTKKDYILKELGFKPSISHQKH